MTSVLIALLGIIGTLTGVVVSGRLQQKTNLAAEGAADRRRRADHRAAAFAAFAGHLIEYRRAELARWYEVDDARSRGHLLDADLAPSAPEARSARSAAWGSYYSMRLLWDDHDLMASAERLLHNASGLEHVDNNGQVKQLADRLRADLGNLADNARRNLNL